LTTVRYLKHFPVLYAVLRKMKQKTLALRREIAFTARTLFSGRIVVHWRNWVLARELVPQKTTSYWLALPPFPDIVSFRTWLEDNQIHLNASGILFFLAMRKHIGFPEGIRHLPFRCMVYEGHETESLSDAHEHTQRIVDAWNLRVVASTSYTTGESRKERPVLLLRRD
jgi:hypothetical protein